MIPLLYLCGRELVSRRAGLVAAALAAVNPFMIWYSQEAREYMLLMALCAASLLVLRPRLAGTHGARAAGWWAVVSALALLTQYFAGFLIAAEGLALVYRARSRGQRRRPGRDGGRAGAVIPHVIPRLQTGRQFITDLPLSLRLQQVPVDVRAATRSYRAPASATG